MRSEVRRMRSATSTTNNIRRFGGTDSGYIDSDDIDDDDNDDDGVRESEVRACE